MYHKRSNNTDQNTFLCMLCSRINMKFISLKVSFWSWHYWFFDTSSYPTFCSGSFLLFWLSFHFSFTFYYLFSNILYSWFLPFRMKKENNIYGIIFFPHFFLLKEKKGNIYVINNLYLLSFSLKGNGDLFMTNNGEY